VKKVKLNIRQLLQQQINSERKSVRTVGDRLAYSMASRDGKRPFLESILRSHKRRNVSMELEYEEEKNNM
jgi:hypothetical protein